jgi:hypothetical protein
MIQPNPGRVAIRYLFRDSTDSVTNLSFSVQIEGDEIVAKAISPRLGVVGHARLEALDLLQDEGDYFLPQENLKLDEETGSSWGTSGQDLKTLRQTLKRPDLGVYGMGNTWVDRRFRAEAVGERLYLIGIAAAAKENCAVVPNHVYGGSKATSLDARRVWSKLWQVLPHVGPVTWGGGLALPRLLREPLKPRRGHGFGRVKPTSESYEGDE